jgi:uncharacterized protein (DUF1778 family)
MKEDDSETKTILPISLTSLERHLVEHAAALSGLQVQEYARRALMLQTELNPEYKPVIALTDRQFLDVNKQLHQEPAENVAFEKGLSTKAPWEN